MRRAGGPLKGKRVCGNSQPAAGGMDRPECFITGKEPASALRRHERRGARSAKKICDKIARVLPSFKPQWTALAGARELYETFIRHALKVEDFEGPRYRRIDRIQTLLAEGRLGRDLRWTTSGARP